MEVIITISISGERPTEVDHAVLRVPEMESQYDYATPLDAIVGKLRTTVSKRYASQKLEGVDPTK